MYRGYRRQFFWLLWAYISCCQHNELCFLSVYTASFFCTLFNTASSVVPKISIGRKMVSNPGLQSKQGYWTVRATDHYRLHQVVSHQETNIYIQYVVSYIYFLVIVDNRSVVLYFQDLLFTGRSTNCFWWITVWHKTSFLCNIRTENH